MKNRIFIFITFTLLLFFQNSSKAITLAPFKLNFESEGGEPLTQSLTIWNEQKMKLNMKVYPRDILFDKKGRKYFKEPGTLKNSFAKYISVSPESFILKGGEKKVVNVTVNPPKGIIGGTQSVVIFEAKKDKPKNFEKFKASLFMNTKLGAIIFYENPLTSEKRSRIKDVKITKSSNPEALNIEIGVINTGNTHFNGSATVAIMGENELYIGNISIPSKIILPDRNEVLRGTWRGNMNAGQYHALITYQYAEKNIVIDKVFNID